MVPGIASAMPITINSNSVGAGASDSSAEITDVYTSTAIPASATVSAVSGTSSSINNINYLGSASGVSLGVDMSHTINNLDGGVDYSMTYDNIMRFTANESASYSLSGFYDITGTSTNSSLYVNLSDVTTGSTLYLNFLTSSDDTSFLLGNDAIGSLTGSLITGHEYQFFFVASIGDTASTLGQATASGEVVLDIGDIGQLNATSSAVARVPEPEISVLLASGLLGIVLVSMRRPARRVS